MSGTVVVGPTPAFSQTLTGYRLALVRVGDNLERIAERELKDAKKWAALVTLNSLVWPWITDDPDKAVAGSVLLAGQDTILVPSSAPPATGVVDAPDPFGTDCLLVNGQLTAADNGDVRTVRGPDNLTQALEMRLASKPRDLVYYPRYGNRAWTLLGQGATPLTTQLAASWVAACVRADPRISATSAVSATTTGDVLAATAIAIAVNGQRLPVGIPATQTG